MKMIRDSKTTRSKEIGSVLRNKYVIFIKLAMDINSDL